MFFKFQFEIRFSILDIYKCPFFKKLGKVWNFDIFVTIKKISVWSPKK